ncbi:MAG: ABC transporter permease [Desulfurococcaceae archaeon]
MARKNKTIALFKTLIHYRSFLLGTVILLIFIGLTVYAFVTWPYDEAIKTWNNPANWEEYPKTAPPEWITLFTGVKEIPGTIILDSKEMRITNRSFDEITGLERVELSFSFDYDVFPQDVSICFIPIRTGMEGNETIKDIGVHRLIWSKPNGINITIRVGRIPLAERYCMRLRPALEESPVIKGYRDAMRSKFNLSISEVNALIEALNLTYKDVLFTDDQALMENRAIIPLRGTYRITYTYEVKGIDSLELRVAILGTVYGIFGTDRLGRDLFMGVAWGTPYALTLGLVASLISTLLVMLIAAFAAWYRSVIDITISRVNEIFMVLPFLPTIMMIMVLYGFTIWTLLGVVILFSVLGSGAIKSQRALFLQIREMPYIEAARAYGASNIRIVFMYMVPKVIPMLIPNIITSVPSFVFLEAALAVLGVSDPLAITWGKILDEAYRYAALLGGAFHWIFAPALTLFLLSIAFASIGFTLDRVLNPKLRQM